MEEIRYFHEMYCDVTERPDVEETLNEIIAPEKVYFQAVGGGVLRIQFYATGEQMDVIMMGIHNKTIYIL